MGNRIQRLWTLTVVVMLWAVVPVNAQQIFVDEFNGSGLIDQTKWRLAFGGDGAFFGRTEVRTNLATDYPSVNNGAVTLELDTFRDDGMGASTGRFLGTEINTKRNFARGGGLRFEARARLSNTVPGLTGGMFLFDVQRTNDFGELVRDEIDHELLSNDTGQIFTNFWNDGSFVGPDAGGSPVQQVPFIGYDANNFHNYRVDWFPNRIDWYVDNTLVRRQTENIPDDPVQFRANIWAPDEGFVEAFNSGLQPATNAGANQVYDLEIDRVEITQLNTERSASRILDGGFEDFLLYSNLSDGPVPDEAATEEWIAFNNAFIDFNNPDVPARTGENALLMFGPFSGGPNASGIWQNFDATPGEEFEASVWARTISTDSIQGEANFATIKLEFLDESGQIIPGLGDFIGANGKESVILEGRDPGLPNDDWIQRHAAAIAPEGTTTARVSLLMVQLEEGPGAIWFDDLEVVALNALDIIIDGDFNDDGIYDCSDIDALVAEIANGSDLEDFDLSGDGEVTVEDVTLWLAEAGAENLPSGNSYLMGDATLDGSVDVSDFNAWNSNKFTTTAAWCSGDFNADGNVDVSDFNTWNSNKFQTSADNAQTVPEPAGIWLAFLGFLALVGRFRSR